MTMLTHHWWPTNFFSSFHLCILNQAELVVLSQRQWRGRRKEHCPPRGRTRFRFLSSFSISPAFDAILLSGFSAWLSHHFLIRGCVNSLQLTSECPASTHFSILIRRCFFITPTAAGMAAGRIIVWTPPRQQWLNSGCSRGTSWFFCTELTVYLEPGALTGTAHMVFSLSLRPPYSRAVTREEIKRNQMLKSLLWQRLLENQIKWSCSGIPYRHSYYDQYQGVQSYGCTAVRNK